jgi:hypothetical protein
MRLSTLAVFAALSPTALSFAQNKTDLPKPAPAPTAVASSDASARLPVKRVVLYKNGVGYFEHRRGSTARRISTSTSPRHSSMMF